jgi:hypothetical protein
MYSPIRGQSHVVNNSAVTVQLTKDIAIGMHSSLTLAVSHMHRHALGEMLVERLGQNSTTAP